MAAYQEAAQVVRRRQLRVRRLRRPRPVHPGGMDRVAELAAAVGPGADRRACSGSSRSTRCRCSGRSTTPSCSSTAARRSAADVHARTRRRRRSAGLDLKTNALTVGGAVRVGRPTPRRSRTSRTGVTRHPLFRGTVIDAPGDDDGRGGPAEEDGRARRRWRRSPRCGRRPTPSPRRHRLGRPAVVGPPVLLADGFTSIEIDGRRLAVVGMLLIGLVTLSAVRSLWWALVPILAGLGGLARDRGGPGGLQPQALALGRAAGGADHRADDARGEPPGDPLPRRPPPRGRPARRRRGRPSAPSPRRSSGAPITGAIGYGALVTSDVVPIQQFGAILGICTLVAALLVMAISPIAMLPPFPLEVPVRYGSTSWVGGADEPADGLGRTATRCRSSPASSPSSCR